MLNQSDKGKTTGDIWYDSENNQIIKVEDRYFRAALNVIGYDRIWVTSDEMTLNRGRFEVKKMNYQELIETAYDMTENDDIKAALSDGELLAAKEAEWTGMTPEEIIADIESAMR